MDEDSTRKAGDTLTSLRAGDALLIVDLQRDFLPGGRLAVSQGDCVLSPINRCLDLFVERGLPVVASRDWHPPDHCSFRTQGGPWPTHCVAGTPGAGFVDGLHLPDGATIVSKATHASSDAYSAFEGTDLASRLHAAAVKRLFVGGLATDYCVLHSVTDALACGFAAVVLRDAIAAVDATPGDGDRAIERMRQLGAVFVDSALLCAADAPTPTAGGATPDQPVRASTASANARSAAEISTR